ncbi:hypothetical protein [Halorarius litoreus]|uniref:DUF7836 family putative zinc-binding protein n=1 Tax=Halorarius litoreus TaxID=2962676 RepID=UPI0020CF3F07|nr:hypothetical protein [Halorarius litoreus]
MQAAFAELTCPNCAKLWEEDASYMPDPDEPFACPACTAERLTSAFARTDRDLEVLQRR